MTTMPGVKVSRYRERFMNCGSCRAAAVSMISIDGKMFATSCARHVELWRKRALAAANA